MAQSVKRLPGGRIGYRIKKLRDGRAKHRVMTPLEFLARLAATVPPPRYPLLRLAGSCHFPRQVSTSCDITN
jgi:hypothetical protein